MNVVADRSHFGARLRQQREARALTVPDIVKITKIPEKQITHLEDGAFDDLPAEVFVRGFLKSYCKAVGLDAELVLVEYHELMSAGAARKAPPSLARLASSSERAAQPDPTHAPPPAHAVEPAKPGEPAAEEKDEESSIFAALASAGRSTSRASLTVAVIILVIVATVTLSLLLRRPGHVGDGVSRAEGAELKVVS